MATLNRVTLIGFVGSIPQEHTFPDGNMLVRFSVATDRQSSEVTDWHQIVTYNSLAEKVVKPFVHTGSYVCIEGMLCYRNFERDGQQIKSAEIRCSHITLLDPPPARES